MVDENLLPKKPHAIIICYPLQGHVIPTVELAIKLASTGFTITFINTQSIHKEITHGDDVFHETNIFSDAIAGRGPSGMDIRYMTVPDGLPVGFDRSLNHDQFMASLLHVFSAHVEEVLVKILESDPSVRCLIADTFFVFPGKLANKYGLVYASFWTEPALVFTLYYHLHLLRSNGHFGCPETREDEIDYIPGVSSMEPTDLMSYLQDTNTHTIVHQIIFKAFEDTRDHAHLVLCNTVQELEPDVISALHPQLPFLSLGPLFPSSFSSYSASSGHVSTSLWSESDCSPWLDAKPHASVLYVSFGSYAHLTKTDLVEIAFGLLLSDVEFLWVMRPDIVSSDDPDPLPVEFKEGLGDRGMIVNWCCQKQVLSHPAIGGFLTHCGWNSILESIWCEVPLVCLPLLTDQFTNRKLVVDDWKIGINLCENNNHNNKKKKKKNKKKKKTVITRDEISRSIKLLMDKKTSLEMRNGIKELKMKLEKATEDGGSSSKNLDQFFNDLSFYCYSKN